MSPITVLTANSTETEIREMIKYTLTTLIPTILLSVIIYYLIGLKTYTKSNNSSTTAFISIISRCYNTSFWLLLPPLLVIILSFLKVSISISLTTGLISGAVLGIIFQGTSLIEIFKCSIFGYKNELSLELSAVFKGGGIKSMLELIAILLVASAFSGLLSNTKILDSLLENSLQKLKNGSQLIIYTILLSTITAIFGCNQLMSIVIPPSVLMASYKKFNISKLVLARAISDSGIILSPIIPWNVCAIIPAAIMNVEVLKFAPYSVLCFLLPVLNILYTLMDMYKVE